MKNPFYLAVCMVMAATALAGCSEEQPAAPGPQTPEVAVAHPVTADIVDWDNYVGRFQAVQAVDVRPRVSGYLTEIHFEDGELVEAGDVLFTIDPRPYEARLQQARSDVTRLQATLKNLRTQLERQRTLVERGTVSQERFDTAQADVDAAEAELAAARARVEEAALEADYTTVEAPVAGRVSYRRVDVGNAVSADSTLLTRLVSVDPIHFVFEGSEALYLKYKRQTTTGNGDMAVRIRLQDEEDYNWTGHLDFVDAMLDGSSGTIRGRAVVDNPEGFLIPGMFGHMQLQGSAPYKGILIPDAAVTTIAGKRVVYVVGPDDTVSPRSVELGPMNSGMRVIRSGLSAEDRIVVDGIQRLRPGMQVQVVAQSLEVPDSLATNLPSDR